MNGRISSRYCQLYQRRPGAPGDTSRDRSSPRRVPHGLEWAPSPLPRTRRHTSGRAQDSTAHSGFRSDYRLPRSAATSATTAATRMPPRFDPAVCARKTSFADSTCNDHCRIAQHPARAEQLTAGHQDLAGIKLPPTAGLSPLPPPARRSGSNMLLRHIGVLRRANRRDTSASLQGCRAALGRRGRDDDGIRASNRALASTN